MKLLIAFIADGRVQIKVFDFHDDLPQGTILATWADRETVEE